MRKPRLVIAGANSGVGKTSLASGLMSALCRRGLAVQPFKVGPDYIDPAFHSFVTGRKSRNLDAWMLGERTIRELFVKNAAGPAEGLSIIEGVMGLFDGHVESGEGSSAHVAQILEAPVILVINGASISRSAAALVHGYNTFLPGFKLAGVIINMLSGAAHYELLRRFVEEEAQVPCFGYLVKNPELSLESRHLGLVPSLEVTDLKLRLERLAEAVEDTVDLDGLLALAASAPALAAARPESESAADGPELRLGLALDAAFNFYYEDGLDLLRSLGAELVPFSPVSDKSLPPNLDGLYIGGGFPEMFAEELAANLSLREEIKNRLENGLPAYAECGGLMYLCRELVGFDGRAHKMVGFFPQRAAMTKRLQNFGYVEVNFAEDNVLGPAGSKVRAHEFHHSRLEGDEPEYMLKMIKNKKRSWAGGLAKKNVLAAYPHLHFQANPDLPRHFIALCGKYRGQD